MFESFSRQAEHGASIGQVHRASKDGREFAVKVQYPGVADSLRNDLRLIKPIALQVLGLRQQDVENYFREVEARLLEETDYALELRRSIELSCSSSHLENVSFPTYYPELSSSRVLTMDWVAGIPLDRYADSDSSPAEREKMIALCERSIELLSRPFRERNFDFGKPELMTAIYEMGEENRKDETLRSLRGRRGSADSIYVNRTFFGLYSLLGRGVPGLRSASRRCRHFANPFRHRAALLHGRIAPKLLRRVRPRQRNAVQDEWICIFLRGC